MVGLGCWVEVSCYLLHFLVLVDGIGSFTLGC